MKTIQKLMFLSLMYLAMPSAGTAQPVRPTKSVTPEKPFIFNRFPSRFECNAASLKNVFNFKEKDQVSIQLTGKELFSGTVTSKVEPGPGVTSMNIMSVNYPGTMLNISMVRDSYGNESISGMMINPKTGDMLVIERAEDKYFIRKELSKFVIADCPLPENVNRGR